jgi:hypothetical protein
VLTVDRKIVPAAMQRNDRYKMGSFLDSIPVDVASTGHLARLFFTVTMKLVNTLARLTLPVTCFR